MLWCVAAFGAFTIAFGLSHSLLVSLIMLFLIGASDTISVIVRSTLIQLSTPDEMRRLRGTLTESGHASPFRDRSAEENLDLFRRMKEGEFPDGARTLRAKIDMQSPNINMRDPVMYRILHAHHHRTKDGKDLWKFKLPSGIIGNVFTYEYSGKQYVGV